jgi:hypothetical protein
VKLLALGVLLYAPDAHAWGLRSHVFFAQYALFAAPLADPELRAAAARLPRLVLAGACLPDLAIVGQFFLRTPVFRRTHLWSRLRRISACPRNDSDRALALGYATHLLSDVVAHNEFVPEHEARIGDIALVAHLMSEGAMDAYLRPPLQPAEALEDAGWHAVEFVARAFRCSELFARRALQVLMRADRFLRASPIPALCRALVRTNRFELYVARTARQLGKLETALAGGFEDWSGLDPEGSESDCSADQRTREHVARIVQAQHHAGGGREQGEGNEHDRERRIVAAADQRERHRVKRVV